jgi:hypothetical protein
MQKTLTTLALGATLLSSHAHASDDVQAKYTEEARKTAQEFMQKLGGILKQQLESAGPESAVAVCKEVAPALAAEHSKDGQVVKRVSLKPRNPTLGVPDEWENATLQNFESRLRQREPLSGMEKSAFTEDADGRWFRYMKAIPTQPMCLQCHGQPYQISDGVKAILAKEYPNDQATGYSAGSIRGAVSIKKRID